MILILYVEAGTGSFTLAKNVQYELNKCNVRSQLCSLHELLPPLLNRLLFGHYKNWCVNNKQYFSSIYQTQWFYPTLYKLLPLMMHRKRSRLNKEILSLFHNVDAVIACSFFCGWFACYWQKKSCRQFPLFGVLGDYTVSPGWKLPVDKLFIPFDFPSPVFDYIRRYGGNITVSGIPVDTNKINRSRVKGNVLLCGGGWGLKITEETIATLLEQESLKRLIVLCGQNVNLYNELCSQLHESISCGKLEVHGFINDMDTIYNQVDIVVTKAGGMTLTEAALNEKPIIISGYLPGHEQENMRVFVQQGAALFAEDTQALCQAINTLTQDDNIKNLLIKKASFLVNRQASNLLCNIIIKDIQNVDA
ncbi:UDP-N-acetylglucosamine:LPS N-acetylglucosamine transferase [Providencia alcalifaciens]|uniref:UDP-N-acetylglucosamine:LPS N-acetylglucosamine transferase n=1 Tax=Providencia alcalifaciens TaxID=126385 RepID=A0A4R3ND02_9GAMM|nr:MULTISPECIES: glycosyltransferase [Providencia]MBC5792371.1 glycosyltransferase [Providencia sp. JUb39]TCT28832.1 UDP-N-acetylglucosamine:LPS N-acetylglucosamine transferase [Providencia alcalifaciens]